MEAVLISMLEGLPNFAIAVFMLWWTTRIIEADRASKDKLIDALLQMVTENREMAGEMAKFAKGGKES